MSVTYNGTNYYYATNLQGDVTAILNTSGTAVVTYTYDAWGKLLTTGGTMADTLGLHNPLRYRGYVYDSETGLYYLQSRYYDPELGRFINADAFAATGQGLLGNNMFAYCNNDPTTLYDPTGRIPVEVWLWLGKGTVGAITSVSSAYISGESGVELTRAALVGFGAGVSKEFAIAVAVYDAVCTTYDFATGTDNACLGLAMGTLSLGTSFFSGEYISKLPGVVVMDEAAELLFDGVFGYSANVFSSIVMQELMPEKSSRYSYTDIPTPLGISGASQYVSVKHNQFYLTN